MLAHRRTAKPRGLEERRKKGGMSPNLLGKGQICWKVGGFFNQKGREVNFFVTFYSKRLGLQVRPRWRWRSASTSLRVAHSGRQVRGQVHLHSFHRPACKGVSAV